MKEHFEKFLGLGNVTDNPNDLEAYSYDASELPGKARLVLFPNQEEQLRLILSYCNRSNLDVIVRGNGSNLMGMTVPNNSVIVSTQGFDRIHAVNETERWVNVDCGVTIAELNEALKGHGWRYPLETSSRKLTTVGGWLATNGAARQSQKHGRALDTVVELEVMDGTGKFFTVKTNFQEYLGLEGTVFIFLRAKLRIVRLRDRSADVFYFDSLQEALEQSDALLEKKPLSIEFLDGVAATYAGINTKHSIIVEWEDGEQGAHKYEDYAALMQKREHIRRSLGVQGWVLIDEGTVEGAHRVEAIDWCLRNNLPVAAHIGLGIIHPFFKRDQEKLREDWTAWLVQRNHGVTGQFGYGLRKKRHVPDVLKTKIRQLKERYDYNNTLARGKMHDFN